MTSHPPSAELVTRHSSLVTAPFLSVRDLTVEVPLGGRFYPAVDGVSFELARGACLAVVGESGCGKTLLGRGLVRLPPPGGRVRGSVRLGSQDLSELSDDAWRRVRGGQIGFVFQEPASAFDPVATIGSQIVEAIRLHRAGSRREALARARELLAEVGFPDPDRGLAEFPHRLSGGLRQRAFLALALAADPPLVVADEPTTALDATVAAQAMELLERLRRARGLTLLLITHDLGLVARHSDRALVLYAGRVVEEAATEELFRSPRHPYTRGLLASAPRLATLGAARLPAIAGGVPDLPDRPAAACAFAPRCPDRFEACDRALPQLADVGSNRVRCFLYPESAGGGRPA